MKLTKMNTSRFIVVLVALSRCEKESSATELRLTLGMECAVPSFNSTLMQVVDVKLATKKKLSLTRNTYAITKKGLGFLEDNEESFEDIDLATIFDSPFRSGPGAAKRPEPPSTESENAAITGLATLIDENKLLRGLLARHKQEIENALN